MVNWTISDFEREIAICNSVLQYTPDDMATLEYYYWLQLERARYINQMKGVA